jgi:replicative DNA helicase
MIASNTLDFTFIKNKLNLKNDELIILGGRPGMGKTLFAINLLNNSSQKGCFISLCDSDEEIFYKLEKMNIISSQSNFDSICMEQPTLLELMELVVLQKDKFDYFVIDDMSGLNEEIERLFNHNKNYQFVFRHLKLLAKSIGKTIILLSQLDTIVEEKTHTNRYNIISWKEKYIDHILIIYRSDYYKDIDKKNNIRGISNALLYVAKTKLEKNSIEEVKLNFKYPFWSLTQNN